MESTRSCLNCGAEASSNFCSNCGQKSNLTPIRMKDIGSDFVSSFINYEGPFLKTITQLFYNPGRLVHEFLEGKRKKYYPPVRYLLICLAVSVLVVELFDYDPIIAQMQGSGRATKGVDSNWLKAGRYLHKHINYFIFLFPFSTAFMTKLFFWRKRFLFAERTVLGFYLSGQFLMISSIMIPVITYFPKTFNWNTILILSYLSFAFFNFFLPKNKFLGFFQSILAAIMTFFVYVFLSFFLAYFIILYRS